MMSEARQLAISTAKAAQWLELAKSALTAFEGPRNGKDRSPGEAWALLGRIACDLDDLSDVAAVRAEDVVEAWPAVKSEEPESGASTLALNGSGGSVQFLIDANRRLELVSWLASQSLFVRQSPKGWTVLHSPGGERREIDLAGVARLPEEMHEGPDYAEEAKQQAEAAHQRLEQGYQDARRFRAELKGLVDSQAAAMKEVRKHHAREPAPAALSRGPVCPFCDAPMEAHDVCCPECGTAPVSTPGPPASANGPSRHAPVRDAKCSQCGTALYAHARFCPGCRASRGRVKRASNAKAVPPSAAAASPAGPRLPPASGSVHTFVRAARRARRVAAESGLESKLVTFSQRAVEAVQHLGIPTQSGAGALLARLIRACLADRTVYREMASNPSLQGQAWGALLTSFVLGGGGLSLLSLFAPGAFSFMLLQMGLRVVFALGGMAVVRAMASGWQKKNYDFGRIFRPMAIAQSPMCLQLMPLVGELASLWCLVTNSVAVRQATGCDTGRSLVLSGIGVAVASYGASVMSAVVRWVMQRG